MISELYGIIDSSTFQGLTIKNYIDCYEKLNIEDINILTGLFKKMENANIKPGHIIHNNVIQSGYKLTDREKDVESKRSTTKILNRLNALINHMDLNDEKRKSFVSSITLLVVASSKLSNDELYTLNQLFGLISLSNYKLDEPIDMGKEIFYTRKK